MFSSFLPSTAARRIALITGACLELLFVVGILYRRLQEQNRRFSTALNNMSQGDVAGAATQTRASAAAVRDASEAVDHAVANLRLERQGSGLVFVSWKNAYAWLAADLPSAA
jgi:type IV secretory pathway TrbF-like protein